MYKSDNDTLLTNYRPILVLSVFSTILEKSVIKLLTLLLKITYYMTINMDPESKDLFILVFVDKVTNELDNKYYSVEGYLSYLRRSTRLTID